MTISLFESSDPMGRRFRTLRLSLTPHCNFACFYCVPSGNSHNSSQENKTKKVERTEKLGKKEVAQKSPKDYAERVRRIHEVSPLQTVRLTGGEPLLYKKIDELVALLKKLGILEIKLTTNAYLLENKALSLKQSGLASLNASLDAIEEASFRRISPLGSLAPVLRGIEVAKKVGLAVKLNATILRGRNEDQILPLLEFALKRGLPIRFLEAMKMGPLASFHEKVFVSQQEFLNTIQSRYQIRRLPRSPGSTANYWQILGTPSRFGIIANHSESFCHDCHRLRMDSHGNLYGCLSSSVGFGMPPGETELRTVLKQCLAQKKDHFSGSEISMKAIGG